MNEELLKRLRVISPEERQLLDGKKEIDRSLYMHPDSAQIDRSLLPEAGRLITLRPHTRFAYFPAHTHNYVEMVYMCAGSTRHIINGCEVALNTGELLILSQNATQEIYPAGEGDIGVNFMILPQFFDTAIRMIGEEESPIRDFLTGCLCGQGDGTGFLHFRVADILPIQNLIENLIWTLVSREANQRSINQLTMGLLFIQLINHTEAMQTDPRYGEQQLMLRVLRYVEEHYCDGGLRDIASRLHYDECWLSREIKKQSGRTFTELMQSKRLNQAVFLLKTTSMRIQDISGSVGYENFSYFHRMFQKRYGMTPSKFRQCRT